ncbi:hypothetical protein ACLK1S_05025 [Escherichia coli]
MMQIVPPGDAAAGPKRLRRIFSTSDDIVLSVSRRAVKKAE